MGGSTSPVVIKAWIGCETLAPCHTHLQRHTGFMPVTVAGAEDVSVVGCRVSNSFWRLWSTTSTSYIILVL